MKETDSMLSSVNSVVGKNKGETNTGEGSIKIVTDNENSRWEDSLRRSQNSLRIKIAKTRAKKCMIKSNLKEEKYAINLLEREVEMSVEAIWRQKVKIASMKANHLTNGKQKKILLKLQEKYTIAKSKLCLNHLEEQFLKLQKDVEKRKQNIKKLSHEAHKLEFSIPLVAEAGPQQDDEKKHTCPQNAVPSVFFPTKKECLSKSVASSGITNQNVPDCWNSYKITSTSYSDTPYSVKLGCSSISSEESFIHDYGEIQVIDLDWCFKVIYNIFIVKYSIALGLSFLLSI